MRKVLFTLTLLLISASSILAQKVVHISSPEFSKKVYNLSLPEAKWVYLGDKPAIVDFYATWCPPCKALSPILDELAKSYGSKIVIYKVDVDKNPEIAKAFQVTSIPVLLYIPLKKESEMELGLAPKEDIINNIKKILEIK